MSPLSQPSSQALLLATDRCWRCCRRALTRRRHHLHQRQHDHLSFGSVNPLSSLTTATATLSYTCSNSDKQDPFGAVCFSIGEPGGGQTNPRLMLSGSNTLQFQLYQNPGPTTIWGSLGFGSPTPRPVAITLSKNTSTNGTATLYGQVLGGQTSAIPGSYTDVYQNGDTAVTVNDVTGTTAPATCDTNFVGHLLPVHGQCDRHQAMHRDRDLEHQPRHGPSTATNIAGNNSISVSCSNTTPYYIGLLPSNNNSAGAGMMSGTGGNTEHRAVPAVPNAGLSTRLGQHRDRDQRRQRRGRHAATAWRDQLRSTRAPRRPTSSPTPIPIPWWSTSTTEPRARAARPANAHYSIANDPGYHRASACFGHKTQSRSGCFSRPASSPASGPEPAK